MPQSRARLIWVVVAALAWQFGIIAEGHGLARDSVTALLVEVSAYGLGLGAIVVAVSNRAEKWLDGWTLFGLFTFFFVTFGIVDAIARAKSPYTTTTDAHVYMDYAGRVLLAGRNPYDTSLYGAIVSTRTPIEFQTPLDNAGMSDRLAYPSLSVLYLLPFIKLGIPTTLAYAVAFYGCMAILFKAAPRELRPLVLIPFFADETYLAFAFGGITDTVWALLLCLVVVTWRRPRVAALLFGLACSYKQHPWLLAPFLAIRIATETPRGERFRALAGFFGIAAAVFVVLDVPFLLWGPKAWIQGVVEPLTASMVPLGEGISSFLVYAGWSVPKAVFSLAFFGTYGLLLLVCASWRGGRVFLWIAPSIAFFFNYRSLNSYWYFNLLPLVVELVQSAHERDDVLASDFRPLLSVPWKRFRYLVVAGAALLVGIGAYASHRRNAAIDVVVQQPIRTFFGFVYRVDVKVTNRGNTSITPRFWLQGGTPQPLPWRADGPNLLLPNETGTYSLDAPNRMSQFELPKGARITVSDLDSSLRKSVEIPPDEAALSPHAVPNAHFRFWDVSSSSPTYWLPARSGSAGAHIVPMLDGVHQGVQLVLDPDVERVRRELVEYCQAVVSCYAWTGSLGQGIDDRDAKDHRIEMSTELAAHPGVISFWVNPPKDANIAPALDDRYGVELSFGNRRITVLLGGEPGSGLLDDGSPYEVVPGPRERWSLLSVDLGRLQAKVASDLYPRAESVWRFPLIDIPMIIVKLRVFYASKSPSPKSAQFGPIEDSVSGRDRIEDELALIDAHPGMVDAWRSQYEWRLKNPSRAKQYLARARAHEKSTALDLDAAGQALATQQFDEADRLFTDLLPTVPVEAQLGLANVAMVRKEPAMAKPHYELALALIAKAADKRALTGDEGLQQLAARLGLSDAQKLLGECDAAMKTLDEVPKGERDAHVYAMSREKSFANAPCK